MRPHVSCLLLFVLTIASPASSDASFRVAIAPRPTARAAPWSRLSSLQLSSVRRFTDTGAFAAIVIADAADSSSAANAVTALAGDPDVEWAEIEQAREATLWDRGPASPLPIGGPGTPGSARFPSDPLFVDTRQWGLANDGNGAYGGIAGADIHARGVWAVCTGANDVRLALIDTGIDVGHPELAARRTDGSQRIAFAADLSTDMLPVMADSFGHGTLVAGVMAARTNEGVHFESLGVAGVCGGRGGDATGCTLIPIRVTRGRGNSAGSFDIARAILYAASHGARAVNLSMAGSAPSRLERLALQEALAMGTVVVAAAGNHGFDRGDAPQYPAAYAADGLCIQVGASDPWDRRVLFSSHGPGLDLVAPGLDIWTTFMTYPSAAGANWGGYAVASGTSLAAPFVTGTLGLMAAARPELTDTDFQNVLRMSADDLDPPGADRFTGHGRLNAARALAMVAPDRAIVHVRAEAQSWRPMERDTLTVAEYGEPMLDALSRAALAERWEVGARIVIPDSLSDSTLAWMQVTGTTTLGDGFDLPYLTPRASVERIDRRTLWVHGSVYRLVDPRLADTSSTWLPGPPESMTFAVTLLGPRRTTRIAQTPVPAVLVTPNPARSMVVLGSPRAGRIEIIDPAGRRMLDRMVEANRPLAWDLRDPSGNRVPPGIYFVRTPGHRPAKLVVTR